MIQAALKTAHIQFSVLSVTQKDYTTTLKEVIMNGNANYRAYEQFTGLHT